MAKEVLVNSYKSPPNFLLLEASGLGISTTAPPQQLRGRTTEVVAEANGGRERGDGDGNLHTFLLIRGSFYNTVPYNITTLPEDNVNLFGVIFV